MKYGLGIFLVICAGFSSWAQSTLPLAQESDDYSTYLVPKLETGLALLEASNEGFKELMKKYHYQEFHRGNSMEYLAPTSRINQMRLIRKDRNQVHFLFSPTKLNMIQQLEQTILARKPIISKDLQGMTWYQFPHTNAAGSKDIRVGIKMESDSEDRMGRTWTIWSSAVIFSY